MSRYGTLTRHMIAIGMVFILILVVYFATSALNNAIEDDPEECSDTFFSIENICFDNERTSFNNFHTTINIKIQNKQTDINGFTLRIFGEKNIESAVLFKTVKSQDHTLISVPYEKDISGRIKKIEIKPMLNLNQKIFYCSLEHGTIYEGEIPGC